MPLSRRVLAGVMVAGGLVATLAAADPIITSITKPADLRTDGSLLEWPALRAVEPGLEVASANDARFVYLAVRASSEQMRVSLSGGLVVWLDPTGGHKETFGFQLPGPPPIDPASLAPAAPGGLRLTPTVSDRIDLLGPGRLARRLIDLGPGSDVQVATGGEDGGLVFEIRIPLTGTTTTPTGLRSAAGRSVALGLATPIRRGPKEPEEPFYPYDPYARVRILGLGGPEPPQPPLPDSSRRPDKVLTPRTVKVWATVKLAPSR